MLMKCIHEAAMVKDKIRQTRQKDEKEKAEILQKIQYADLEPK